MGTILDKMINKMDGRENKEMNINKIIDTDEKEELVVREKHEVYISFDITNLPSYKHISFPSKYSGFVFSNKNK